MIATKDLEPVHAAQFQALADPVRLQIVMVLQGGSRCVCEIQSAIGPIAGNLLSYHLGILRNAGLVSAQRRGRWLDYRLEHAAFEELRASLPQHAPAEKSDSDVVRSCEQTSAEAQPTERPRQCARRVKGAKDAPLRSHQCG